MRLANLDIILVNNTIENKVSHAHRLLPGPGPVLWKQMSHVARPGGASAASAEQYDRPGLSHGRRPREISELPRNQPSNYPSAPFTLWDFLSEQHRRFWHPWDSTDDTERAYRENKSLRPDTDFRTQTS
ncbi:hypothetical protein HN011_012198 [Eciton burchellii]|nr:hypothetical protein HN011_012198 [Eciton burchellii]